MRTVKLHAWVLLGFAHIFIMLGCRGGGPPKQAAIGEGFIAPMSLNIRQELSPRAPVTATLQHGERLEILERRRRFVKVRTADGKEGWTDSRQLLSTNGMERIRQASKRAEKLPSQGRVSPFDVLNVHIEPYRQAPSFYQLPENDTAELVGRLVNQRVPYVGEQEKSEKDKAKAPPPPPPPPDAPKDDWSLIRLKDGRSGWVLSRLLMMNLPDEVTQYAEGHRITSYFPLGEVEDDGVKHTHWLWTTVGALPEKYQFDSFRVFIWSLRRHRYETAYRENKIQGYYPTVVSDTPAGKRFIIVATGKDGNLTRRTYDFNGAQVKLASREPYTLPVLTDDPATPSNTSPTPQRPDDRTQNFFQRIASWFKRR